MPSTSLQLLQHLARSINVEVPTGLSALTQEQQQLLRFLDERHAQICGMKPWWFLRRIGFLNLLPGATGASGGGYNVTGPTVTAGSSCFVSGTSTNGKFRVGTAGEASSDDVYQVTYASGTTATVLGTVPYRATVTNKAWEYGQDEYVLPSDVKEVLWAVCNQNTVSTLRHVVLRPVSMNELHDIRARRGTYITLDQPTVFCVPTHGAAATHLRYIVVDPFPVANNSLIYGYIKVPVTLYGTASVYPDLPPDFEKLLIDMAVYDYYNTLGMGAPAGSPAGPDLPNRIAEVQKDVVEATRRILNKPRAQDAVSSFDPASVTRTIYREEFGRIL
jgi:hypothetical protein